MGESSGDNDERSVQVRFNTRQPEFSIPSNVYSVGLNSTVDDLSQLVNTVLKEGEDDDSTWESIAFDFRIAGDVLRTTLEKHIESKMLQKESVLELEYFTKEAAPEPCISCPHPDWVAAVSAITAENDTLILTGCYDGSVNLWSLADGLVATVKCHSAPVKSVALVRSNTNDILAISGSHDQVVTINRAIPAASRAEDWQLQPTVIGRGHAGSVDCVAVSPNLERFASGSWDTMLKIWDFGAGGASTSEDGDNQADIEITQTENESRPSKSHSSKRKMKKADSSDSTQQLPCKRVVPLVTLSGHSEGIADLAWLNDSNLVTVGFDHALVFWDLASGHEKRKIPGVRAFLSVAYSPLTNCLLTSSTDRHIRLYDPRSTEGNVVKSTFTSHASWVSAVDWSKSAEYLFISGSYDSVMKLWDIRSPKMSLYDMSGHEDKVLDVCWSNDDYLLSASADSTMKIFSKRKC